MVAFSICHGQPLACSVAALLIGRVLARRMIVVSSCFWALILGRLDAAPVRYGYRRPYPYYGYGY